LGECLVSWLSKKQSSISLSTTEAEYIAATGCCTQVLWMKQTLTDIQVEYDEPIPIYCDNTSTISISKNPVFLAKPGAEKAQRGVFGCSGAIGAIYFVS
jgi:hypothetical protein